jgi:hypothetical protein
MVRIERQHDELNAETWAFTMIDMNIVMTAYSIVQRESKRHKWKPVKSYDAYSRNRFSGIDESVISIPQDVQDEALNHYASQLKVCKFSERKR